MKSIRRYLHGFYGNYGTVAYLPDNKLFVDFVKKTFMQLMPYWVAIQYSL